MFRMIEFETHKKETILRAHEKNMKSNGSAFLSMENKFDV